MRELEHIVAWDAPVEVVAALDSRSTAKMPEPLFVASLGLASLDGALQLARDRGATLTPVRPGVYRVSLHDDASCAVAAALGAAPARLVCGDAWPDVEELLPYATRGLPTRDLGRSDIHVEVTAEPVRRRYAQEIGQLRAMAGLLLRMASLDDKRFDATLTDIAYGLADELKLLANELDHVRITGTLDAAGKTLDLSETIAFRTGVSERSFLSETLQELGRRATLPPDAFWQLPAKASSGVYSAAPEPARFRPIFASVAELTDAYLEHERIAPSLRQRARRILEAYPSLFVSGAIASGPGATPIPLTGMGWSAGVMNVRADVVTAMFADVTGLLGDRQLGQVLKARLDVDPKLLPKARTQVLALKGFPARATALTIEIPAALAKRLEEIERANSSAGAPKPGAAKAVTFTGIVVPDGERSYVAYGAEQKELVALLEAMRSGTEKKLADVLELAPLRQVRAPWAGYWTLTALAQYMDSALEGRGTQMLARAPNHGRSPWLMRMDVADQPSMLSVTLTAKVPQGAIQDFGSLIPELTGQGLLSRAP
jgi:hypothetical protein